MARGKKPKTTSLKSEVDLDVLDNILSEPEVEPQAKPEVEPEMQVEEAKPEVEPQAKPEVEPEMQVEEAKPEDSKKESIRIVKCIPEVDDSKSKFELVMENSRGLRKVLAISSKEKILYLAKQKGL